MEEKELFEWWVQKLTKEVVTAQKELDKLSEFKSEIQKAEFERATDRMGYQGFNNTKSWVWILPNEQHHSKQSLGLGPDWSMAIDVRESSNIKTIEIDIKNFLLKHGFAWSTITSHISDQLTFLLERATKIRHDILYPEVAEMERKNNFLKSRLAEKEKELERCQNTSEIREKNIRWEFESQLAALKIEHDELEKEHSDRNLYLAEKEKELAQWKIGFLELRKSINSIALNSKDELEKYTTVSVEYSLIKGYLWNINLLKEADNKILAIKSQFAEKEKEIEKLNEYSSNIHNVLELCVNVERNKDDFRRYFPSKNPENSDSDAEKIWNIFVNKCEIKVQLAALKIEHNELEKEHSDRGLYLAGKEKEIEYKNLRIDDLNQERRALETGIKILQDAIEKAVIALNQTKKIFKSKTIAQIRERLIDALPLDKQTKFICLGCGIKRE